MTNPRDNYKSPNSARSGIAHWRLNADGSISDEIQQIKVGNRWKDHPYASWWHVEPSQRRLVWRKRT